MRGDGNDNKIMRVLKWAISVEPKDCCGLVEGLRGAYPNETPRQLAERLVASYARKGGFEGFMLGLPSNPLTMLPIAAADMGIVLRFYATMTAAIGYLANPRYFDDPLWADDAIVTLAGPKVVSRTLREAGVQLGKQGSRIAIRKYLSKEVLRALKRWVAKWLGVKLGQRAIIAKAVPIIGGIIGGSWNFIEIRLVGKRIIAYHFGDGGDEGTSFASVQS